MKKLSGEEVLSIVEQTFGNDVSAFAYGDYTEAMPEDFEFSEEVEKVKERYENAYKAYQNHEAYNVKSSERTPEQETELNALYEAWRALPSDYEAQKQEFLNSLGLGEVVEVDQYGGEGQGDTWYSIKHFVDHDVYIRTDGFYASYSGTDFYDGVGKIVTPKEKTVTVYE
ncbi:MAG: hypothetical protein KDH96_07200 [Candidatus Riesia sp.]|nr:hypothetical protein [Candidatus Riesia sp.]